MQYQTISRASEWKTPEKKENRVPPLFQRIVIEESTDEESRNQESIQEEDLSLEAEVVTGNEKNQVPGESKESLTDHFIRARHRRNFTGPGRIGSTIMDSPRKEPPRSSFLSEPWAEKKTTRESEWKGEHRIPSRAEFSRTLDRLQKISRKWENRPILDDTE